MKPHVWKVKWTNKFTCQSTGCEPFTKDERGFGFVLTENDSITDLETTIRQSLPPGSHALKIESAEYLGRTVNRIRML